MGEYYGFNTRRKRNLDLGGAKKPLPPTEESWSQGELEEGYEEIELENDEMELEEDYEEIELENDEYESELNNDSIPNKENVYNEKLLEDNIEKEEIQGNNSFLINGQVFVPKKIPKRQTFKDTHVRVTTYLEKNLHQIIHILQEQGQIESITKFMNDSIKQHLMSKYNNNN